MTTEEFFAFLQKRQGLLDAVCVSGGEPTLQPDLADFLRRIKQLGFLVKLDTNGNRPDVLKQVAEDGLVDYVAMDVKNCPSRYAETAGLPHLKLDKIEESLAFLIGGSVGYELRTTVVAQLHDEQAILEMGQWLASVVPGKKPRQLFLQSFVDRDSVLFPGLTPPETEQMERFVDILAPFVHSPRIRSK